MKPELDNQSVDRYMRVYNYYKQLILSQQLAPGSRLPSSRRCAAELQMSRTTVETAYMVLAAEGYIISRPQSGFYVTDIGRTRKTAEFQKSAAQKKRSRCFTILRLQVLTEKPSGLNCGGGISKVHCGRMSVCSLMENRRENTICGRFCADICKTTEMWFVRRNIL